MGLVRLDKSFFNRFQSSEKILLSDRDRAFDFYDIARVCYSAV
jgi:hypothetical protein